MLDTPMHPETIPSCPFSFDPAGCFQELQFLTVDTDGDLLDSRVRGLLHEMVPNANLGGDAFDCPVWRVLHCRASTTVWASILVPLRASYGQFR